MKIISLKAENFKKLKAVEITPDGNIVTITGKNAAGKSSVLDAIWSAIGGRDANPTRPVRDGEESASVTLDLGEYVVTRKWKDTGTTSLTVASKDGAKYGSPQKLLDGLMGEFTFNPIEFLEAKDRRGLLLKTLDIKPNWADWQDVIGEHPTDMGDALAFIEATRKEKYGDRADINREATRLKAALDQASAGFVPSVVEPIDLNALIAERDAAQELNRQRTQNEATIDRLRESIATLKTQLADAESARVAAEAKADAMPVPVDCADLTTRINAADAHNRAIAGAREKEKTINALQRDLAVATQQASRAHELVSYIDEFRGKTLESADMPVPGLGFDMDGAVTLDGLPFDQASAAQKLRCAIAIAMKANPKLRVMRIENGEKFDSDSMKIIAEMANENDTQIWMELMNESGNVGIYIEDGTIK